MDEPKQRRPSFVRVKRPKGQDEGAVAAPPTPQPPPPVDERARIVVPRHERGRESAIADADIEVREVRYGATSRAPYLRIVPKQQRLAKVGPGYLAATPLGSRPIDTLGRYLAGLRRMLIGSPFATSQAIHERLSKVKALAVFSSDALSSSAYATEEILIVLALAGSGALKWSLPIAAVIVALLAIVVLSYQQTIRAYPNGGGAYIVAHDNLGQLPGLVAAAALLVDYTLTVSVSVAAGVAAITSAVPDLFDLKVPLSLLVVALFTWGNLRGIRESGTIFSAPTYFFIVSMGAVIGLGMVKVAMGEAPGSLWSPAPPKHPIEPQEALGILLLLRAFSSGSAALTGVEAISNGVPAFKPPESHNARVTLAWMGFILAFLFMGITYLSSRYGLVPEERETIVSQLGREVLGENPLYYVYQAATAMVLFLAANTAFADFPRLSAILANDGYMPRQFTFKGDRLAFTNGILALALAASLILVAFNASVTRLIPLYAVGVFLSFTLSQSGMVRRWWRLREPGWRTSLLFNGIGAAATAVVACIFLLTKFTHGAWISTLLMGILVVLFLLVHRHYRRFQDRVQVSEEEVMRLPAPPSSPLAPGAQRLHIVIPVDDLNRITLTAVQVAREWGGRITAVHITDQREAAEEFRQRWERLLPDVPLLVVESPYRAFLAPMLACIDYLSRSPNGQLVVLLPSLRTRHWWERLLHNQTMLGLKRYLKDRPDLRVTEVPVDLGP
ncbi:MAG TPA: APC family permease [Dehalococcoidia bacterium]|nr:APC family permease [Dehalococcoidia bacterium]